MMKQRQINPECDKTNFALCDDSDWPIHPPSLKSVPFGCIKKLGSLATDLEH